jgi:hypothetical protein
MAFRIVGKTSVGEVAGKSSLSAEEAFNELQDAIANRGGGVTWEAEDEQTKKRYSLSELKRRIGKK